MKTQKAGEHTQGDKVWMNTCIEEDGVVKYDIMTILNGDEICIGSYFHKLEAHEALKEEQERAVWHIEEVYEEIHISCSGKLICHVEGDNEEANARLIAAAPKMLEALEKALKGLGEGHRLTIEEKEAMKSAVKQAKGE